MTPLHKPVRRKTVARYKTLYSEPRQIVITLAPGDVLEFREIGRRGVFPLPISRAFLYAVRLQAETAASRKLAERKSKLKSR